MQTNELNKTNLMEVFRLFPNAKVEVSGKDILDISADMEARITKKLDAYFIKYEKTKENRLIDIKTAAERLGVSKRTVDRMVDRGELRKVFVGGNIRFSEAEIEAIIEGRWYR